MQRTFFAIDIHPDANMINKIMFIKEYLNNEKIKWVSLAQMHLTLKFLGDTREEDIPEIIRTVSNKSIGIAAMNLHLIMLDLFKNIRNPRVIWLGIESNPNLIQLQKIIDNCISGFGFEEENLEYAPHLTLGRIKEIKDKERLGSLIEKYKNESFGKVEISEVVYYESLLKSEGPVYIPISRFPLVKLSNT